MPAAISKLVNTIFDRYDRDHNGYITPDEYADIASSFPMLQSFDMVCFRFSLCYLLLPTEHEIQ